MKLRYILLTLLALCLLAAPAAAAGGAGTASNPYVIQTPAELQSIQNDLSAHYVLGNDIDMSGYSFTRIGSSSAPFFGVLDGRDFTIRNLVMENTGSASIFSTVIPGAVIKDINFEDCIISGSGGVALLFQTGIGSQGNTVPIIIDDVDIIGCSVTQPSSAAVGSLYSSAYNYATISVSNCDVISSTISTDGYAVTGGLIGTTTYANLTVKSCSFVDSVVTSGRGTTVGGIIGQVSEGDYLFIDNMVKDSLVSAPTGGDIGGICAYVGVRGKMNVINNTVSNSIVFSDVSAGNNVGGICGSVSQTNSHEISITGCLVTDSTIKTPGSYAGGIFGRAYQSNPVVISQCAVANTTVQASSNAAGICPRFG